MDKDIEHKKYIKKCRALESQLILSCSIIEWIEAIIDNEEVGDFALSFPIVRGVYELKGKAEYIESVSNKEPCNFAREYLSTPITDN